ncbi:NADH dehydrogenase subunit J [Capsulimonas corticalis]|uniref:NADH-quinone oxidoreductase subunit J n=1 Tax=Capsulimonas corticalis TaxID=2219043 RepID=A0A402CYH0_9BACT|nr:NADH-quinone oxidoreductase subunit J [Capsulimonas corticalis]BDI31364.1 NADH dehydrogenase subunit J [Capsulimonas corticalis]
MSGQLILFGLLAAIAVVCGLCMILNDNPVRSALFLVMLLFNVAILYVTLNAAFIAAVQVIVYAGAIMVLFIFVIMLLNLGTPEQVIDHLKPQKVLGPIAGVLLVGLLASAVVAVPIGHGGQPLSTGTIGPFEIGLALYSPTNYWLFPFEVVSILLLVAAIGAVMLAKRRI